jgi:CBS-domain-containing membrane protein|tara:strand:+ start:564 stop:857 length:294 start_codon:yes stop_codon:yes gene_type:complete
VVDENGVVGEVISSRDIRQLAALGATNDLSGTVEQSLRLLPPAPPRLNACAPTDTLASAISRLASADTLQLVCVDERGGVHGVITASTVLACLLPDN